MKIFEKRILSLICGVVLLANAFLGYCSDVKATSSQANAVSASTKLENLTLSDAGFTYAYQSSMSNNERKAFSKSDLNNTLFGMYMKSNTSGALYYGLKASDNNSSGIRINQGTSLSVYVYGVSEGSGDVLNYADYGMKKDFTQEEFLLQISVEFGNYDKQGDKDDVKIGVYINEKLCNNKYYYIYDDTKAIGNGISFWDAKPAYYRSYEPVPIDLKNITLVDAGINDNYDNTVTKSKYKGQFNREDLDGTLFGMYIHFGSGDCRFHYGARNGDDYNGVTMRAKVDHIVVGDDYHTGANGMPGISDTLDKIYPETIGYTGNFTTEELLVQISTEFIDYNGDGNENDIKMGIFINGKLQKGEYYIIQNASDYLGVGVVGNETRALSYRSYRATSVPKEDFDTVWSHRDLGLADGDFVGKKYVKDTDETFVDTAFTTYLTMRRGTSFKLGDFSKSDNKFNGLYFEANAGTNIRFVSFVNGKTPWEMLFTPDVANCTLIGNTNLKFTVTVTMLGANAAEIGVYFNDVLYNGRFIYLSMSESNFPMGIDVETWNGNFLGLRAVTSKKVAPPVDFEYLTFLDEGIEDGTKTFQVANTERVNMDKTLTSVKLTYTEEGSRIHLATGTDRYSGISFRMEQGYILISNEKYGTEGAGYLHNMPFELVRMSAPAAGVGDTFTGTEFLLQVSIEFVDKDGDGKKNDIKLGVFINGYLYSDTYFYIKDNAEQMGTGFNSEAKVQYKSYNYQGQFLELTSADFGLKDNAKLQGNKVVKYDTNNIEATAITMMMSVPKQKGSTLYLGGDGCGISLTSNGDGTIEVSYVNKAKEAKKIATLKAKTAGVSALTEKNLKWRFTFRTTKTSTNKGVLQLAIYINGQLYNGKEMKVYDMELDSLKNILAVSSKNGAFQVAKCKYEDLTLRDFSIFDVDMDMKEEDVVSKKNYCDLDSLDSTAVNLQLSLPVSDQSHRIIIGANNWRGFNLISYNDGTLWLVYVGEGSNMKTVSYLQPEKAGVENFSDKDMDVRMVFDVMNTTKGRADVKLSIYFNGKLYNNRPFYVRDITSEFLSRAMIVNAKGTGNYTVKSVEQPADFTKYGFDNNWKKTLGLQ